MGILSDLTEGKPAHVRGGAQGLVGMAAGLGFMGSGIGGLLFDSRGVVVFGRVLLVLSFLVICSISSPPRVRQKQVDGQEGTSSLRAMFAISSARTPGGLMLMTLRMLMGTAFNIYAVSWEVSLKERFDAQPQDFGTVLGACGLVYALSQGVLSKAVLRAAGEETTHVVLLCCIILGAGPMVTILTTSWPLFFVGLIVTMAALAVVNSTIDASVSNVAPERELGSLIGILAAIEACLGVLAPLLGSYIWRQGGAAGIVSAVIVVYI